MANYSRQSGCISFISLISGILIVISFLFSNVDVLIEGLIGLISGVLLLFGFVASLIYLPSLFIKKDKNIVKLKSEIKPVDIKSEILKSEEKNKKSEIIKENQKEKLKFISSLNPKEKYIYFYNGPSLDEMIKYDTFFSSNFLELIDLSIKVNKGNLNAILILKKLNENQKITIIESAQKINQLAPKIAYEITKIRK